MDMQNRKARRAAARREQLRALAPKLRFLDIEASDGGPEGWPIEIGWAVLVPGGAPVGWSSLIRPDDAWEECWSPYAERVHGIPRQQLETAPPATLIARKVLAALAHPDLVVISDSPRNDQPWLDRLLSAAGQPAGTIEILAPGTVFSGLAAPEDIRAVKDYLRENKGPHRAGEDAKRLARAVAAGPLAGLLRPLDVAPEDASALGHENGPE